MDCPPGGNTAAEFSVPSRRSSLYWAPIEVRELIWSVTSKFALLPRSTEYLYWVNESMARIPWRCWPQIAQPWPGALNDSSLYPV